MKTTVIQETLPAVQLSGLVKSFGAVTAVNGLDLTITPGEVVAFLGPNGAGKTSTLDILLGLSRATQGSVKVFGLDPVQAVAQGRIAAVMPAGDSTGFVTRGMIRV
ncbi:hypothetical protein Kisp02_63350 [Kineosporia sp. NBRC 101731]|nr:ATP-binding cassette domain-containing protein [Kineosporia sp. NBRC 101731]GLY32970.1 hypothetical protein Kisp02_63350 [Kineosporia sp. NBRC 101731]